MRRSIYINGNVIKRFNVRVAITLGVIAIAVVASGCGETAAPGENASIAITRDYGQKVLFEPKRAALTTGLTAMRQLQSNVTVKTTYGGRFVNSIYGIEGSATSGADWLFYVDGIQPDIGATAWRIKADEQIQWDFHQWLSITTPEAIVGAYPRPLSTSGVNLICEPARSNACAELERQFPDSANKSSAVTVIVGAWDAIARVKGVPDLTRPAIDNGAFANFIGEPGARKLQLLASDESIAATEGAGVGLIAAGRKGKAVTWVVTGTDETGVSNAAGLLKANTLRNKFAVAVTRERIAIALPVVKAGAQ